VNPGSPDQLALWLVSALVVGGGIGLVIGRARGRPALGFALGFVLGLIGWIVVACIPRPRTVTREQKPSRGWYPDPTGAHEMRYFDGLRWSDDVANRGQMARDAVRTAPAHRVRVAEPTGPPPVLR
jgi:hypothetical protein